MRLDPEIIRHQINNLLVSCPELADDDVLRADMIEGETEAFDFLSIIVRKIGETKALASGTDAYAQELRERSARLERRIEGLRSLAFKIMTAAELRKAELPEATLSVKNNPPKVIIVDESELPDEAIRIKREPNKTAIKELIELGHPVPGAVLSNSEPSLTIRTK